MRGSLRDIIEEDASGVREEERFKRNGEARTISGGGGRGGILVSQEFC
jgi:hypothetical protein